MPHDVHLVEWMGAVNTFVLICSSVTVVLAHKAMTQNKVGLAVNYILVKLLLGGVFLGSRVVHATALSRHVDASTGRVLGLAFTWLPMLAMAVVAIVGYFQQGAIS